MSWRVAKSLEKLRFQLNEMFPNRSKISDGSIGDTKHSARKSDHNPNENGVVCARDFTHDLSANGVNGHLLLNALLASKDKRMKYIIFFGKIYNVKNGFQPKAYHGINAHKHHLHLSVSDNPALYDDDSDWTLDFEATPIQPTEQPAKVLEISRGAKGEQVRQIQQKLHEKGYLKSSQIDADFGILTQSALQRFQLANGLRADGICGRLTAQKLGVNI